MFGPKEPTGWRTVDLGRGRVALGEATKIGEKHQVPVGPPSEASWAGQQFTPCVLLGLISLLGNSGVGEINHQ